MMFIKDEKVFSLARTAAAVPHGDITRLFEEFYCYLLIAGLYLEGEQTNGGIVSMTPMASNDFMLPTAAYNPALGRLIERGLKDRYTLLSRSSQLTLQENRVVTALNAIFTNDVKWFSHITGKDLVSIAYSRQFSDEMKTIAHYVAVAFGQSDYPQAVSVPKLYLSAFGNIHLTKPDSLSDNQVILDTPLLRYGAITKNANVTALWALLSAQITSFSQNDYPGDALGDALSGLTFLTNPVRDTTSLPLPVYASALQIQRMIGIDDYQSVPPSALFYRDFLYNNLDDLIVTRASLLMIIINLMMEKMGEPNLGHLFSDRSFYRLLTKDIPNRKKPHRPTLFRYALEALTNDQDTLVEEAAPSSTPSPKEDGSSDEADPQVTVGGYDPSTPPPAMPVNSEDVVDKDTIDLISFNKTDEGVDEDLYRQAVVALNDRLQNDDSLAITAETKDNLNYWVNGYLYRTAIQATKDYIQFLHLQPYLKTFSTKG